VLLDAGVTFVAPETVFLAADTKFGKDVVVEPYVIFGEKVTVEDGAVIHAFSHLVGAHVGKKVSVGPFARLRPGTRLGEGARIGNFVEVKEATIEAGAKANHLSYIGDASVGAKAMSEPAPSPATTMAASSTAPRSARTHSSVPTRLWSRRWRSATERMLGPAP
jgi:bifunctional N-acetylglucosamine-1-phosphate-uridyltransferase/glucosamine-1-phosphate-acetyltransferase GlmU-like protein